MKEGLMKKGPTIHIEDLKHVPELVLSARFGAVRRQYAYKLSEVDAVEEVGKPL
jgi:tRNA U38,U39,U40 pseudouridine synthase TruA